MLQHNSNIIVFADWCGTSSSSWWTLWLNVVFFFLALFGTDTSRHSMWCKGADMQVYLMSAGSHGQSGTMPRTMPKRCPVWWSSPRQAYLAHAAGLARQFLKCRHPTLQQQHHRICRLVWYKLVIVVDIVAQRGLQCGSAWFFAPSRAQRLRHRARGQSSCCTTPCTSLAYYDATPLVEKTKWKQPRLDSNQGPCGY